MPEKTSAARALERETPESNSLREKNVVVSLPPSSSSSSSS